MVVPEGVIVSLAVAHGLGNARKVVEMMKGGKKAYHFVEVMTCPGGCIGGGGSCGSRPTKNARRE